MPHVWQWIADDMLPTYERLLDQDPRRIRGEIDRAPADRVAQFRLVPFRFNPKDGVC